MQLAQSLFVIVTTAFQGVPEMSKFHAVLFGLLSAAVAGCGDSAVDQPVESASFSTPVAPMAAELIDGSTGLELIGGLSLDFSSTRLSELELRINPEESVRTVEITLGTVRIRDDSAPFLFTRDDGLLFEPGLNELIVAGFNADGRLVQASTLVFFIVVDEGTENPAPPDAPEIPAPPPVTSSVAIDRIELRELNGGAFIRELGNGDTIDRSSLPLMFEVVTTGDVESVTFESNGTPIHIENGAPWQDRLARYPVGSNVLRFVPWTEDGGKGDAGQSFELTVTITDDGSSDPVDVPVVPPTSPAMPDPDFVLTEDYDRSQYRPGMSGSQVFDAYEASWTIDNCGWSGTTITGSGRNAYPVLFESRLGGSSWYGGTWTSNIPQNTEWTYTYRCDGKYSGNSTAILFRGEGTVVDVRMDGVWDGIRFDSADGTGVLRDSWLSNCRDDGIEADRGTNLEVENVLFDNCFVGISSTPDSNMTSKRTIRLNNVLINLGNYNYNGTTMPSVFLKYTSNSPRTEIHNSVFAFSADSFINNQRMVHAWNKTTSCSNNQLLWTSDAPFPDDFPAPPSCFEVIEGAAARQVWNAHRDDFISRW